MNDIQAEVYDAGKEFYVYFSSELRAEIIKEAQRRIDKLEKRQHAYAVDQVRFQKRTGLEPNLPFDNFWPTLHDFFVPQFCIDNAADLADHTCLAIIDRTYQPIPALAFSIPKPDGSQRSVKQFSIVDAAVSNVVFRHVRKRNVEQMSEHSYAYHPNKSVPNAIVALREFRAAPGTFAVQIDFKKFFDSICHEFLINKLEDKRFNIEEHEKHVIRAFMKHEYAEFDLHAIFMCSRNEIGVPQGATISLFLANLACDDLDKAVVQNADFYARFADDTLCFCNSLEDAKNVAALIEKHSERMGVSINVKKSPGITILGMKHGVVSQSNFIDFLGYRYENGKLALSDRSFKRLKKHIAKIIHLRLVHYLKDGFDPSRCATKPFPYGWDLVGLICEINGFLYGGHRDSDIRKYMSDEIKLGSLNGVMRHYCLIEDKEQVRQLDGFTLNIIRRAMAHRNRILNEKHGLSCPTPSNKQLLNATWFDERAWNEGTPPDIKLGSFVRAWKASYRFHVDGKGRTSSDFADSTDFCDYDPLGDLDSAMMGFDDELL